MVKTLYLGIQIFCMKGVEAIDKIDLCAPLIVCAPQSNHKGN